jgi:hypothetical protein
MTVAGELTELVVDADRFLGSKSNERFVYCPARRRCRDDVHWLLKERNSVKKLK